MVHFGVMFMGRALAIQYGDGLALTEFWRAGMHWFNVLKKVVKDRICCFTDSLIFQYKYRIQAHQKVAAAEGVHGKSIAIDTVFNSLVNDKGCRNTNKAGDLKVREAAVNCTKLRHSPSQVEEVNNVWKERSGKLHGNTTDKSMELVSRYYNISVVLSCRCR